MIITQENNLTVLTPDEGKILKCGNTYSGKVYLGDGNSPEDWEDIEISKEGEKSE